MFFQEDEKEKSLRLRERALNKREEEVADREAGVEQKIAIARKTRDHEEAIATIARQDQKLEEDHARRVAELAKEVEQIEADHEHRMEVLKAEEKLQQQKIAALEASNAKELALAQTRLEQLGEAHEAVVEAKDEQIEQLQGQLETVTEKLIAKLPTVNVNDITIVPQASQKGGDQKKQDGQK